MVNEKGYIIDRREMLRIKLKSLVAEVRIIQKEERRMPQALAEEMREHRRTGIRAVSRDTHLALGFLRGRSYGQLEAIHYSDPDWKAIVKMIKHYGALSTSCDMEAVEPLVTYWREHPEWKAPSLPALMEEHRSTVGKKREDETLKEYWERQAKTTVLILAQSKMAA